ncbi:hypothetical protein [Rhodococcus sp. 2G]|uniref:hypothetical protein n=1 Tax=Rhodococcus sp. 2G TaxID=1570939 RepID=UPI000903381D|nr:hypothetical protein [Rhodococcus sp. 2G]
MPGLLAKAGPPACTPPCPPPPTPPSPPDPDHDTQSGIGHEPARLITPVPGGVGPMTIAVLLEQTLTAAKAGHSG